MNYRCNNCGITVTQDNCKDIWGNSAKYKTNKGYLCDDCFHGYFKQDKVIHMMRDIETNSDNDRENIFDGGYYG